MSLSLGAVAACAGLTALFLATYHLGLSVGSSRARKAILSHPSVRRPTARRATLEVVPDAVIGA